jgi:hypothetical protein
MSQKTKENHQAQAPRSMIPKMTPMKFNLPAKRAFKRLKPHLSFNSPQPKSLRPRLNHPRILATQNKLKLENQS